MLAPWIEPRSPTLQADSLLSEPPGNRIILSQCPFIYVCVLIFMSNIHKNMVKMKFPFTAFVNVKYYSKFGYPEVSCKVNYTVTYVLVILRSLTKRK